MSSLLCATIAWTDVPLIDTIDIQTVFGFVDKNNGTECCLSLNC
jgi:hypothetical protein